MALLNYPMYTPSQFQRRPFAALCIAGREIPRSFVEVKTVVSRRSIDAIRQDISCEMQTIPISSPLLTTYMPKEHIGQAAHQLTCTRVHFVYTSVRARLVSSSRTCCTVPIMYWNLSRQRSILFDDLYCRALLQAHNPCPHSYLHRTPHLYSRNQHSRLLSISKW